MTDDQNTTSDQQTVNSEQQNKTVRRPLTTAHPEPFYQDELDVYEAVAKLEEKYGRKILTEEQREKLRKGGRTGGTKKTDQDSTKEEIRTKLSFSGVNEKQAGWLVAGLRAKIKSDMAKYLGEQGWSGFTEKQKQYAISCYFRLVYGVTEFQLTSLLAGEEDNA